MLENELPWVRKDAVNHSRGEEKTRVIQRPPSFARRPADPVFGGEGGSWDNRFLS